MKFRGGVCCLVCAALALATFALAPTASAAAVSHPGTHYLLSLPGSHGYSVEVTTQGSKQVTLTALKGESLAVYTVLGRVTRNRIDADFGALGRISVRFSAPRPRHRAAARPASRCHGRAPKIDVGSMRGAIRFSGEEGFTEVAAHRAEALRIQTFRRVCRGRPAAAKASAAAKAPSPALTLLAAIDDSSERHVSFAALGLESNGAKPSEFESEPGLFVVASTLEHREAVKIVRGIFLIDAEGGVLLSKLGVQPVSMTVALPSPFAGSATYLETPGTTPSWSGDLSISLPGARHIALTGANFRTVFCRTPSLRAFDKCTKPLEEAQQGQRVETMLERTGGPAPAQLSGSQSQAFWDTRLSWLR